jgi:hypothetical protein
VALTAFQLEAIEEAGGSNVTGLSPVSNNGTWTVIPLTPVVKLLQRQVLLKV